MKHCYITLVIFALYSINLTGQRIDADSIYQYDWFSGDKVNIENSYTITSKPDSLVQVRYSNDFNGVFSKYRKNIRTYDENGNEDYSTFFIWNDIDEEWSLFAAFDYDYNSDNLRTAFSYLQYDEVDQWSNFLKYEYSEYDAYNYPRITKYFDGLGQDWILDAEAIYERFYVNDLLDSVNAQRNFVNGSIIPFHSVLKYTRDTAGNIQTRKSYKYDLDDNTNIGGLPNDLTTSEYFENTDFLRKSTRQIYDDNQELQLYSESEFERGDDGRILKSTRYDYVDGERVPDFESVYYYPTVVSVKEESVAPNIASLNWFSPNSRALAVDISDLNVSQDYQMYIHDVTGKVVKYKYITNQEAWSQQYILDSGMFVITIVQNEHKMSKQVIVK